MDEVARWLGEWAWPALLGWGFLAGVIGSLFGVGGGMVTTPLMNLLGLPMPIAVATSTPVIFGSSAVTTFRNRKLSGLNLRAALWMAAFMLPSVEIFARLMATFEARQDPRLDTAVRMAFVVAIIVTTAMWLTRGNASPGQVGLYSRIRVPPFVRLGEAQRVSVWVLAISGLLAGFFAGFLGLGGGRILVPVFIGVLCMPLKPGVATSSAVIFCSSLLASVSYGISGLIDYQVAAALLAGAVAGAWFGSGAMHRIETKLLRALYLLLSLAALGSLCLKQAGYGTAGLVCLTAAIMVIAAVAITRSAWLGNRAQVVASRTPAACGPEAQHITCHPDTA